MSAESIRPYVWVIGLTLVLLAGVLGAAYGRPSATGIAAARGADEAPALRPVASHHEFIFLYVWELNAGGLNAVPVGTAVTPAASFAPEQKAMQVYDPEILLSDQVKALVLTEVTVLDYLLFSELQPVLSPPWEQEIPDLMLPGFGPAGGPSENLVENEARHVRGLFQVKSIGEDRSVTLRFGEQERQLAPGEHWSIEANVDNPSERSRWGVWHMGVWNLNRVYQAPDTDLAGE